MGMNYLRLNQLKNKFGISKSKIYLDISKGLFPQPIKVGRSSFWLEYEIDQLMCFLISMNREETEIKEFVKTLMEKRKNVIL